MTPNIFIRVGDTDCWDVTDKALDMSADSTLRVARNNSSIAPNYKRIGGRKRWAIADIPASGLYLEGVFIGGTTGRAFFGLTQDGTDMEQAPPNAAAKFVGYRAFHGAGSASITNTGTYSQTTGLPGLSDGDRVGQLITISDADNLSVSFSVNGTSVGVTETYPHDGNAIRSCAGCGDNTVVWQLCADADDQLYRPSNAQPWGAAARVSDLGGYSPAGSKLAETFGVTLISADQRTAYDSGTATNDSARASIGRGYVSDDDPTIWYFEVLCEDLGASGSIVAGIGREAHNLSSYPGQTVNSWGMIESRRPAHDGVQGGVMTGLGSFAAGSRMMFAFKPATSQIWMGLDGAWGDGGDPEAGTGAQYINVTTALADVFPMLCPNSGRLRLCTHPWEQLHRPSYATAWDGPDILPEQHHRSRIASDTEITQELWFQPWGGSRKSGSPIGAIELHNQDGRYDPLRSWDLRDQQIAIYERIEDGSIEPLARALVDNVKRDGRRKIRVMSRGMDAALDVRIDAPMLLFGSVAVAEIEITSDSELEYRIGHRPWMSWQAVDGGIEVYDAEHWDNGSDYGLKRNVNPAAKQAAYDVTCFEPPDSTYYAPTNNDFSAWTGDVPDDWSETSAGTGTANVTPGGGGSGARFIRGAGESAVSISTGSSIFNAVGWVRLTVSAYTSGDLVVQDSRGARAGINGTGTFWVHCGLPSGTFELSAITGTDLTISDVRIYVANRLNTLYDIVSELLSGTGITIGGEFPPSFGFVGLQSDQRPTRREILDGLCDAVLIDRYSDADGFLRFVGYPINPSGFPGFGSHTPVAVFDGDQRIGDLGIEDDLAPSLSDGHGYAKNFSVHSEGDLVDGVSVFYRRYLVQSHRINRLVFSGVELSADYDTYPHYARPFHGFYAHAVGAKETVTAYSGGTPFGDIESGTSELGNNLDERLWALHRTYCFRRRFFNDRQSAATHRAVKLGDMVTLTDDHITGLPTDPVMVVKKVRRLLSPTIEFKLWG